MTKVNIIICNWCSCLLLPGYRSVPLKNSYNEELELASLLVHIEIVNAKVVKKNTPLFKKIKIKVHQPCVAASLQEEDDKNLYTSIQRLRDQTSELSTRVSLLERSGSADLSYQQSLEELRAAQDQLSELVEARNRR